MIFNLSEALQLITNTLNSDDDPVFLSKLLEETKATYIDLTTGTTKINYRPYYIIGMQLWLKLSNNLIKGEGAQFDQNYETTRRYLIWQKQIDENYQSIIPANYTTDALLEQVNGASSETIIKKTIGFLAF